MCIGAIAGDVIGSRFEGKVKPSRKDFLLFNTKTCFTDDTVHTIALAESILTGKDYVDRLRYYYRRYPYVGYGSAFKLWAKSNTVLEAYNSWGNGSAMRVSPISYIYDTIEEVMEGAKKSAEVTHSHEEGIKGAQAVAFSIFMIRMGAGKQEVKTVMSDRFGYKLDKIYSLEEHGFDCSSMFTVPQSIAIFVQSDSFEDCIRKSICVGGDTDTTACISGSIAGAYYRVIPKFIQLEALKILPRDFIKVISEFSKKYEQ